MNAPVLILAGLPKVHSAARPSPRRCRYIQRFHGETIVIKYGGNAMTDEL